MLKQGVLALNTVYEFLSGLKNWLEVLGPVGVGFGIIWRYYLKKKFEDLKEVYDLILKIAPKVENIEKEVTTNGGSSIKDAIKRIEFKIASQDQKLNGLLKTIPHGIFTTDKLGNWTDVNLQLCRLLERTESELMGNGWLSNIDDNDIDDVLDRWNFCVQSVIYFDMEFDYILPDDQPVQIRMSANPLKNEQGEMVGFFGTMYLVN